MKLKLEVDIQMGLRQVLREVKCLKVAGGFATEEEKAIAANEKKEINKKNTEEVKKRGQSAAVAKVWNKANKEKEEEERIAGEVAKAEAGEKARQERLEERKKGVKELRLRSSRADTAMLEGAEGDISLQTKVEEARKTWEEAEAALQGDLKGGQVTKIGNDIMVEDGVITRNGWIGMLHINLNGADGKDWRISDEESINEINKLISALAVAKNMKLFKVTQVARGEGAFSREKK